MITREFGNSDAGNAARFDALADEFEQAFRRDQTARIEDFLSRVDEHIRAAALCELLKVEIELRRDRGEPVSVEQYLGRFSGSEAVVHDAFHLSDVALATTGQPFGAALMAADTVTFARDDSVGIPGRLQVRCPSCHAPFELAVDSQFTDVTCTFCGSQFSLINENDASPLSGSLAKMGRFELLSRLGMGAFGTVWKARDKELDRTVAIKIPRQGGMTAEEQEQFFREARAAAQLRHPNIVSVHEVGRDGDSVYIVSDFVRGVTLADWLSSQSLTGREAANLCAKIADALHHAHEQGVVHRDLKPANIMIDGDGQPHLMDFGLARREAGEVTVTVDGQIMGTPAYMSPEQAQGEAHKADRRSDVYSLGVILFQLLTGELPFRGNVPMLLQQVVVDEPPNPRKFNANIPKDLETITLKCLQKDPNRRYQSSAELGDELRRFLAGEPIHARPAGRIESAWKWAKRRPAAATILLLLVFMCAGFATAFFRERDLRGEVVAQKTEAEGQRAQAEYESESAQAVVDFLTEDVLAKASPEEMPDQAVRDTLVRTLIEPAAESVGQRFKDKPHIEAAVRHTLAVTLSRLGRSDLALAHSKWVLDQYRTALGQDHPETSDSLIQYAVVLEELGRSQEAEPLFKLALEQLRSTRGEDHPDTIRALNNYAYVLDSLGRTEEAEPMFKRGLDQRRKLLGHDHPATIKTLTNYAIVLESLGRAKEAEPLFKQALEQSRKVLGDDHPDTIMTLNNYADALENLGRPKEAEPLFKQALEQTRKVLGEEHRDTIMSLHNYASVLVSLGRTEEAEPMFAQAVEQYRRVLGEDHPETIRAINSHAIVLESLGRSAEAETLRKQAPEQPR